jgi:hypothetical protein
MNRQFQEEMWLRRASERDAATDGARSRDTGEYTAENVEVDEGIRRDPEVIKAVQIVNQLLTDFQNILQELEQARALGSAPAILRATTKVDGKAKQAMKKLQKVLTQFPDILDWTGVGIADLDPDVADFINSNMESTDFDPNKSFSQTIP